MKRSTVLIGVCLIILGISILGGLSLMDSKSIEKTKKPLQIIESDLQKQEKNVSNNVKCSPTAFGGIKCLP